MKILFIAADLAGVGGIQRYNRTLITALKNSGGDVILVELKSGTIFSKILVSFKFLFSCAVRRPDLVFCSHVNFAKLCYAAKKIFGIDYILMLFGIDARDPGALEKKYIFEEAKKICSVSRYTIEKLVSAVPEVEAKLFFLENPIDGEEFYPKEKSKTLLAAYGLRDKKVVLTVSRFSSSEKYKGYDKVLSAISLISKSLPNIIYILVGEGDDRDRVAGMVEELGIQKNVIFAGKVSNAELIDYYNLADVFIMPSKFEGFGFVFIEALACGIPVIAGNMDGSPNAVLNGKIGLLVNPDSVNEIKEALENVLLKRVAPQLLDKNFLRSEVLGAYGLQKFNTKVNKLIHEI